MSSINYLKQYMFHFDIKGLTLFAAFMLPTFFWLLVPATNDVLRVESTTPVISMIASTCQIMMVTSMCFLKKTTEQKKSIQIFSYFPILFFSIYLIGWLFYYANFSNPFIILTLTLAPSFGFLSYQLYQKNAIAVCFTVLFTILHLIETVITFF